MLRFEAKEDGQMTKTLFPKPLMPEQVGFGCKHMATFAVLDWLYSGRLITEIPLPSRKHQYPGYKGPSLRWHLKNHFQSTVGVVHNVEDVAALAELHSQVSAHYCECRNKEEYITTLVKAIDQERPPIVFYDIEVKQNDQNGQPLRLQGHYEHAAVLVGYYFKDETKLIFIASTWGKYFEYDADELYQSTNQLPKVRTEQEVFFKLKNKASKGMWLSEYFVKDTKMNTAGVLKTLKETSPTKGNGCWNKILILDSLLNPGLKLTEMPVKFSRPTKMLPDEKKCLTASPTVEKAQTLEDLVKEKPDLTKHFHFTPITPPIAEASDGYSSDTRRLSG